jgi:UDP-N-acetylglucosamine 4,6-dehydratase/5-epimerase
MKKTYFITGGTGSLAKKIIEHLVYNRLAKKIILFSRDEFKQSKLYELPFIKNNISIFRFFIGDVRDLSRLEWAIGQDVDVVIHTAALKQVPTTEYNPFETVKTNILGSQNIIEVSIKKNIDKTVLISTDKAVSPINLYGATKLTAEKLFISANLFKGKSRSKFSVMRYGNVMGSRGSVIPIFLMQNRLKNFFTITDKRMTRFNITLNEAASFVMSCISKMQGKEIFVPKCSSYRIMDVSKAINPSNKVKFIGLRQSEKIHEELINKSEYLNTIEKKDCFIIYPLETKIIKNFKDGYSYNSFENKKYLSIDEIKKLIKKNISDFEK